MPVKSCRTGINDKTELSNGNVAKLLNSTNVRNVAQLSVAPTCRYTYYLMNQNGAVNMMELSIPLRATKHPICLVLAIVAAKRVARTSTSLHDRKGRLVHAGVGIGLHG